MAFYGCTADKGGCSGDLDVYSQADLDTLANCRTYTGTVLIESTLASSIVLPGVAVLTGDVVIKNNTALGSITFPKLQVMNGTLKCTGNIILSKIDWPSLTSVRELDLSVLPSLSSISFPSGLYTASKITVMDTTAAKMDGLKIANVSEVAIVNNRYLKSLDLGEKLKQVSKDLTIGANSPDLSLDFSNLKELQQGTLSNLANLSLEGLEKVHGDISLLANYYQSLEMPKLANVTGSLTLADNSKLEKLSVPELQRLGGALSVTNNAHLTTLDAFPKLEEVGGTLDLTGSFNEVKLPKLQDVR
ncbi:hypothetical protein BX666DRAFT_1860959 [Dichotomocladium elegans]|nr:hypothetical protein BX666DRAFT_1860959 [Dichotomocladium elegans]